LGFASDAQSAERQIESEGENAALLVIASEAKQSSIVTTALDCFVASLLAMTTWAVFSD